jgi:hypothetical protein
MAVNCLPRHTPMITPSHVFPGARLEIDLLLVVLTLLEFVIALG